MRARSFLGDGGSQRRGAPPPLMMQRRKEGHERRWCVAEEEIEDEIAMGGRDPEEARAQSFNM